MVYRILTKKLSQIPHHFQTVAEMTRLKHILNPKLTKSFHAYEHLTKYPELELIHPFVKCFTLFQVTPILPST